ncbi:uncharacterized protein PHACADRAFT_209988, partial [Phanerochaete carnosa HHB-10118-sp]
MATTYSKTIFPVILEQMRLRLTDPSHPPIFLNLLTVKCRWRPTLGIVSDYIPRLSNSQLRTVWISASTQGPREVEKYNEFLSSMKAGYDNVEILSVLSGFSTKDVFGSSSPQLSEYIASLHALRVFRSNVLIDEAAVRHLSLSRHLTNLSCCVSELPQLTIRALLHVAKHWPDLYQLRLPVDALDSNQELLGSLKADELGRCLRTLEMYSPFSYVDDARGVALFLCNLFLNLFSDTDLAVSH